MSGRFPITPSQIPDGVWVVARCLRPGCGGHRYPTRALMIEKAGDIPLHRIEPRVRCIERPRGRPRAAACGGPMEFEWGGRIGWAAAVQQELNSRRRPGASEAERAAGAADSTIRMGHVTLPLCWTGEP